MGGRGSRARSQRAGTTPLAYMSSTKWRDARSVPAAPGPSHFQMSIADLSTGRGASLPAKNPSRQFPGTTQGHFVTQVLLCAALYQ